MTYASTVSAARPWWQTTRFQLVALVAFLMGLVALQWSTTGWSVGFFADDWVQWDNALTGPWLNFDSLRAATPVANKLATLLGGNPFVSVNFVLYVFLCCKVVASSLSLFVFMRDVPAALIFGVLIAVFPADNAVFNKGVLPGAFAVAALCIGFLCLSYGFISGRSVFLLPALVCGLLVVFIYEALYAPMAVLPAALLLYERRFSRRFWLWSILWLLPLVVAAIYALALSSANTGIFRYQQGLIELNVPLTAILFSAARLLGRLFVTGWLFDVGAVLSEPRLLPTVLAFGVVLMTVIASRLAVRPAGVRVWLLIAIFGLGLMAAGFGPYLLTSLRDSYSRTLYIAVIGAALTMTAVFRLLGQFHGSLRILTSVLVAALAAVGTFRMLGQQIVYQNYFLAQRDVISSVLEITGRLAPNTTLVLQDETTDQRLSRIMANISQYAEFAFVLVNYPSRVVAVICYPDPEYIWGPLGESCSLNESGVLANMPVIRRQVQAPLSELVIVRYKDDGTATLVLPEDLPFPAEDYRPEARIQPGVLPERAITLFGMTPGLP
jgi:hypothetical protein